MLIASGKPAIFRFDDIIRYAFAEIRRGPYEFAKR